MLDPLAGTASPQLVVTADCVSGDGWALHLGDGIAAAAALDDASVDLLLTDPSYGIRRGGSDRDDEIDPQAWTDVVLPKVRGWAVTFSAEAQIGTYCDLFTAAGFVEVGSMVWQKTNPVPFSYQPKPVNTWGAVVVGKRSGTAFNGTEVRKVAKPPAPFQRIPATQKPLPLIAEFIGLFSQPEDMVFDPFAGSATTVVAARDAGRTVVGYEADPAVFAAAANRLAMP